MSKRLFLSIALIKSAGAIALADFQPAASNLSSACQAVYATQIPGCAASDFVVHASCTSTCIAGLTLISSDVYSKCGNDASDNQMLIGEFLRGTGINNICANVVVATLTTSTSAYYGTYVPTTMQTSGTLTLSSMPIPTSILVDSSASPVPQTYTSTRTTTRTTTLPMPEPSAYGGLSLAATASGSSSSISSPVVFPSIVWPLTSAGSGTSMFTSTQSSTLTTCLTVPPATSSPINLTDSTTTVVLKVTSTSSVTSTVQPSSTSSSSLLLSSSPSAAMSTSTVQSSSTASGSLLYDTHSPPVMSTATTTITRSTTETPSGTYTSTTSTSSTLPIVPSVSTASTIATPVSSSQNGNNCGTHGGSLFDNCPASSYTGAGTKPSPLMQLPLLAKWILTVGAVWLAARLLW